jgi:mono/diheme cytochrome c family protein
MIAAIAAGIVAFALGIFVLWVLVYASGLVRPKLRTETGVTGAAAMERKVLLATGMVLAIGLILTVYGFVDPMRQASAKERQLDTSIERGATNYATLCYSCHGQDGLGAVVPGTQDTDSPRPAPALNRPQFADAWKASDPDEFKAVYDLVHKTIQRGRPGTPMPPWGLGDGGTLNQEQVYELASMITHGSREINGEKVWDLVHEKVAHTLEAGAPTPIPIPEIQVAPELQAGADVFKKNGCNACHATSGTTQLVGPSLAGLKDRAGSREPGKSAEDYITESVRTPNAFIVPGFTGPPSLMPPFGQSQISDQDLQNLIRYLESL